MAVSGPLFNPETVPLSLWQYELGVSFDHRKLSATFRFETRVGFSVMNVTQHDGRMQTVTTREEKCMLWISSDSLPELYFFTELPSDVVSKIRAFCQGVHMAMPLKSLSIESESSAVYLHMSEGSETTFLKLFPAPAEKQIERLAQLIQKEKFLKEEETRKRKDAEVRAVTAEITLKQLERLCQAHEREIRLLQRLVEAQTERSRTDDVSFDAFDHECSSDCTEHHRHGANNGTMVDDGDGEQGGEEEMQEEEGPDRDHEEEEEIEQAKPLGLVGTAVTSATSISSTMNGENGTSEILNNLNTSEVSGEQSRNSPTTTRETARSEQTKLLLGIAQHIMCTLCPENVQWPDLKHMEQHFISTHLDEEKKNCTACPSDRQANLTQHIRQHANKIYACQFCGKRGQKHLLKAHIRTHTGEKPFACETCGRGFADGSTLRRHKMIHTGEKKHECPICGRNIARKDNVKVHIRSHGLGMG